MFNKTIPYICALFCAVVLFSSCKKDYEDIRDIDDAKIQAYISQNNLSNVQKDPSGFYYHIVDQGSGQPLQNKDSVLFTFNYKSLSTGVEFYTTPENTNQGDYLGYISREKSSMYPSDAFRIAMLGLKRGGKVKVILPSHLAFGKNGSESLKVPSNEIIVSDIVTLPQSNQTAADEARIVDFLSKKGLTATRHSSGVYYIVTDAGTGDNIQLTSTITVKYTGRLLNGTVFDETPADKPDVSRLSNYIPGWQKVLTSFKKGAKVRLFVPSVLAYGTNNDPVIPPNSVLDFDVQITEVTN